MMSTPNYTIVVLGFVSIISLLASCKSAKDHVQMSVGESWESTKKLDKDTYKAIRIYTHENKKKKLHGLVTRYAHDQFNGRENVCKIVAPFHKGKLNGVSHMYDNDTLKYMTNYHNGYKEGQEIRLYLQDSTISYYKQGIKEGIEREYQNHQLFSIVNYVDGRKDGKETFYDSLGEMPNYVVYEHDTNFTEEQLCRIVEIDKYQKLPSHRNYFDSFSVAGMMAIFDFEGKIKVTILHDQERSCYEGTDVEYIVENFIDRSRSLKNTQYGYKIGFFFLVSTAIISLDELILDEWIVYSIVLEDEIHFFRLDTD